MFIMLKYFVNLKKNFFERPLTELIVDILKQFEKHWLKSTSKFFTPKSSEKKEKEVLQRDCLHPLGI